MEGLPSLPDGATCLGPEPVQKDPIHRDPAPSVDRGDRAPASLSFEAPESAWARGWQDVWVSHSDV